MITKLCEIAATYRTDKAGWYTPFYDTLFGNRRNEVKRVLEVGIGTPEVMQHVPNYQAGASLCMWRDYFSGAHIYGVDSNPKASFNFVNEWGQPQITSINEDSRDRKLPWHLVGMYNVHDFDLIVDDGSHDPTSQFETFQNLFPLVKAGGFYIIEDAENYLELSDKLEGYTHQIVLCPFAGVMGKLIVIRN